LKRVKIVEKSVPDAQVAVINSGAALRAVQMQGRVLAMESMHGIDWRHWQRIGMQVPPSPRAPGSYL